MFHGQDLIQVKNLKREISQLLLQFVVCLSFLGLVQSQVFVYSQDNIKIQTVNNGNSHVQTIPPHVAIARSFLYVREKQQNRCKEYDEWNKFVGNPAGSPTCAAFVSSVLNKAGVKAPNIKTGLARNFWNKGYKTYSAKDVLSGKKKVKIGHLPIWARGNGINGHIGIADENWQGKSGHTIEANTPGNGKGKQYEGDGVYRKMRTIQPYSFYRIIGFSEVQY